MTAHLLALTVGPVQDFIAAARRTRDLWFGSHLLSEISRAVAVEVGRCGELIFPASAEADSVANIILAKVNDKDAMSVAEGARQAAQRRWHEFAAGVFKEYRGAIREDIWNDQVSDVIEFYAAWVPLTGDYQKARTRVMRLLGARKNCRDFQPAAGRQGVPKSSLDGMRESVLRKLQEWPPHTRRRLRVSAGEQLDVVGLVKRAALGTQGYPSVARVAADSWLRGLAPEKLAALKAACAAIPSVGRDYRAYQDFPFEGTVVYRSRHGELREEAELDGHELQPLIKALQAIDNEAEPYFAIIVADGDRIGERLSVIDRLEKHRAFSQQVAGFAGGARRILEEGHRGVLVYAGGDDVLALVPVDRCLAAARALRDSFATSTGETLSVGVAIAHFMEPLEDLIAYGRVAKEHAKQPDRDGLAVHVHKRGGGPVGVRARWTENLDLRLLELAERLNDRTISGRVTTDLHAIARVYDGWPPDSVTNAIRRDTLSIMKGKRPPGGGNDALDRLRKLVEREVKDAASLRTLADELLVARQIASAMRQASGQRAGQEVFA